MIELTPQQKKLRGRYKPGSESFVKAVQHACVDQEWDDKKLTITSGVSKEDWNAIKTYQISPSIEHMVKITHALGMVVKFDLVKKGVGDLPKGVILNSPEAC